MKNWVNLSHSALKTTVSIILALSFTLSCLPLTTQAASGNGHFSDVPRDHWAYHYIERAYAEGAIKGIGGNTENGTGIFAPEKAMTYAEFVTMLIKAFYPNELTKVGLAEENIWYIPYLETACDRGLLAHALEDFVKFADASINRYYMSILLIRVVTDKSNVALSHQELDAVTAKIADWNQIKEDKVWKDFTYYITSAYALGLLQGKDEKGTFAGNSYMTRAEAAVVYTQLSDCITVSQNDSNPFQIIFEGDWDAITTPGYQESIEEQFYTVYPRLWARWGSARIPKTIHVYAYRKADMKTQGAAAYMDFHNDSDLGYPIPYVVISVEYANTHAKTQLLSHELTHVVQSYMNFSGTWWKENMAGYGRFRYWCWADKENMDKFDYHVLADEIQCTWEYNEDDNCHWFFAYMDDKYPTTEASYGLIDSIHLAIRRGKVSSDGGAVQNNAELNAIIQQITGFENIEQLRQKYKQELVDGTWTFDGFADYADNYITEDLPNIPNPTYPSLEEIDVNNLI